MGVNLKWKTEEDFPLSHLNSDKVFKKKKKKKKKEKKKDKAMNPWLQGRKGPHSTDKARMNWKVILHPG